MRVDLLADRTNCLADPFEVHVVAWHYDGQERPRIEVFNARLERCPGHAKRGFITNPGNILLAGNRVSLPAVATIPPERAKHAHLFHPGCERPERSSYPPRGRCEEFAHLALVLAQLAPEFQVFRTVAVELCVKRTFIDCRWRWVALRRARQACFSRLLRVVICACHLS